MKIAVLIIAAVLAIAGWLKPTETPQWLNIGVVSLLVIALTFEIWLDVESRRENKALRKQIADLHSRASREPAFELALNGKDVREGEQVELTRNGHQYPLEFSIRNIGSQTANGVHVHLLLPSQVEVPFLGKHWQNQDTPTVREEGGYRSLDGITQHSFISPVPIHPGDWLKLGHGFLARHPDGMNPVPLRLKVSVEGGEKGIWNFTAFLQ